MLSNDDGVSLKLLGSAIEIWRYPVRSIGGERVTCAQLDETGVVGDRQYALVDVGTGLTAAPEKDRRWHNALNLRATLDTAGRSTIHFPSNISYALDSPALNGALSEYFGFPTAVARYDSGRTFVDLPLTSHRYAHSPLHLLTTSSLRHLARIRGVEHIDHRRFRPTVLIETSGDSFVEDNWVGQHMLLGAARLSVQEKTKRCAITMLAQPGIDEDTEILRTVLRHNKRYFGIYCSVQKNGRINLDDLLLIEPNIDIK